MIAVKEPQKLKRDIQAICTLTRCGEIVGYTKSYISSIISGSRSPNSDIAIKLCELLNKQFDEYFFIVPVDKCQQK